MEKVRVRNINNAVYIDLDVDFEGLIHNINIKVYKGYIHIEILPKTSWAEKIMDKFIKKLGVPYDGPRLRVVLSDCGEEPQILYASWSFDEDALLLKEKILEILSHLEEME